MNAFKDVLNFGAKAADSVFLGGAVGKVKRRNSFADLIEQGDIQGASQFAIRNGRQDLGFALQQQAQQQTQQQAEQEKAAQDQENQFFSSLSIGLSQIEDSEVRALAFEGMKPRLSEQFGFDEQDFGQVPIGDANALRLFGQQFITPQQQVGNQISQQNADSSLQNAQTGARNADTAEFRARNPNQTDEVQFDPSTIDTFATEFLKSGSSVLTKFSGRSDRTRVANLVVSRANEKLSEAGLDANDLARIRGDVAAFTGNVKKLQQNLSAIKSFEGLAKANADRLLVLLESIPNSRIPIANAITRATAQGLGGVDQAEFSSVLATFRTEVAGILGRMNPGTGTTTDALRKEIEHITPSNATKAQLTRIINRLKVEMSIREGLIIEEINLSRGALSSSDVRIQDGGDQGRGDLQLPNGDTLNEGETIIQNGQTFIVRDGQVVPAQ